METGSIIRDRLDNALRNLASGNLGLADFGARDVLDLDPQHAEALAIVGRIALKLGLRDQAISALTRSVSVCPSSETIKWRQEAEELANIKARPGSILVIKAWRAGFWSEVSHVLGGLLLAELTGRTPVTLWGSNCLYNDGSTYDAFRLYFEAVSEIGPSDLENTTGDFFPSKWTQKTLHRNEYFKFDGEGARLPAIEFFARSELIAVVDYYVGIPDLIGWIPESHKLHGRPADAVYRYLIKKYLRPGRALREALVAMDRDLDLSGIEIAVHIRGSDKVGEVAKLAKMNSSYLEVLSKIYDGGRILLLTEDDRLISGFMDRFGDKLVIPAIARQRDGVPPHFRLDLNPVKRGIEAARDTYAASRAGKFLGNGYSNFSCFVPLLMPASSKAYLLGKSTLYERNSFKLSMTETT